MRSYYLRQQHKTPYSEVRSIAQRHCRHVKPPQRNGRCVDANFHIVVAVHHGVFGVVCNHPKQVAEKQHPSQHWHARLHRCKRHRYAKTERHTQHRLRHGHVALGKRIRNGDGQCRKRPGDGGTVGGQHQAERQQRQHRADRQGFATFQFATGDWALSSAFDVSVKVAVGDVIDAAPGAAH